MYWIEQILPQSSYDFIVTTGIAINIAIVIILLLPNTRKNLLRRLNFVPETKKLLNIFVVIFTSTALLILYAYLVEPNLLKVTNYEVNILDTETEDKLKVVVIGDLQYKARKSPSYVEYMVNLVNEQDPDLVLWVGDLIEGRLDDLDFMGPFSDIQSNYGKYAVLGNHDYGFSHDNWTSSEDTADGVANFLDNSGFSVLRNDVKIININNLIVGIAGTEDEWSGKVDFNKINSELESFETDLNLLMIHEPRTLTQNSNPELYDFVVAGHCHNRQVNLGYLNFVSRQSILDSGCLEDQDGHVSGRLELLEHDTLVTPGVGVANAHIRLFAPPEISIINLR